MIGLQQQLGGDVALLGALGVGQALARMLEIGAGILPVRIEEERVQIIAEVVVMGDVAPRPARVVALTPELGRDAKAVEGLDDRRRVRLAVIVEDQAEEIVDRALLHHQPTVGEELAAPQVGIEQKGPDSGVVSQAGDDG
jgi:hypothetical protein